MITAAGVESQVRHYVNGLYSGEVKVLPGAVEVMQDRTKNVLAFTPVLALAVLQTQQGSIDAAFVRVVLGDDELVAILDQALSTRNHTVARVALREYKNRFETFRPAVTNDGFEYDERRLAITIDLMQTDYDKPRRDIPV